MAGNEDDDDNPDQPGQAGHEAVPTPRFSLRRVDGPVDGGAPAPEVRLHREFKGLTVADLMRLEIAERLPGQVRQALRQIQNGDLSAADEALPGAFPPILQGPCASRSWLRSQLRRWWWLLCLLPIAVGAWWLS